MGAFRDIELIFSFSQMTSTYVKLQDAHAAETGAVGTWQMIGYIAPGAKQNNSSEEYSTTVFDYTNKVFTGANNGTTMVGNLSAVIGWTATAKTALNDCKIGSHWDITMQKSGEGASVKYTASTTDLGGSANNSNCTSLTANFANIGHE